MLCFENWAEAYEYCDFGEDQDPRAFAIGAFCAFAVSEYEEFKELLVKAILRFPKFREFLLNDPKALDDKEDGYRGYVPDMVQFNRYAWPAYLTVPGLQEASIKLLSDPLVLQAERELRQAWEELPYGPSPQRTEAMKRRNELEKRWVQRFGESGDEL